MTKRNLIFVVAGIVLMLAAIVVSIIFIVKHEPNVQINTYESDTDEIAIDYDDDNDRYDVFIFEENRHIFVPRNKTEIVIADDNEIIVVETVTIWGATSKIYFVIDPFEDKD